MPSHLSKELGVYVRDGGSKVSSFEGIGRIFQRWGNKGLIFRRNWVNISEMGEPRLVSRVKVVAQRGSHTIFVSQINKENESFNELPTQHFR